MPNILSLLKISEKQVADVRIDTQPGTAVVLSFETYLRIHSAGSYEFKLTQSAGSSSSSELWINGIRVAGCMCCASQGGTITLPAGRQHLKVVFFWRWLGRLHCSLLQRGGHKQCRAAGAGCCVRGRCPLLPDELLAALDEAIIPKTNGGGFLIVHLVL